MSDLVWTMEAPTEPGYYWVRQRKGGVVSVAYVDAELVASIWGWATKDVVRWYAGPIPKPQEPEEVQP